MNKEKQLKLCKQCKNRSLHTKKVRCKLYGKIPNFRNQCGDYQFSKKVKTDSGKLIRKSVLKQRVSVFLLFLTIFAFVGALFSNENSEHFWIQLLIYGVSWLFWSVLDIFNEEES